MKMLMPQIGMTMTEGTIGAWLKEDGSQVTEGEDIMEVETEKLTNNIPAPASGTLKIIAQVGDTIECGEPVAEIE